MGFVKVILSAFIQSLTFGFNGIYNIILGLAKNSAIKEYYNSEKIEHNNIPERLNEKYHYETKSCYKLCFYNLGASVLYLILSLLTTFVIPEFSSYGISVALLIACTAFFKIIMGIVSSVKTRKVNNIIIHYIKYINLSDGLISLSLCQSALICLDGVTEEAAYFSGIGSIAFSALAILFSVYMIIELRFIKKRRIIPTVIEDEIKNK